MSLATRCSSCGTTFRVVQDQLRVSEGWVRCGRCSTVFNALEALFDMKRGATIEPSKTAEEIERDEYALIETSPETQFHAQSLSTGGKRNVDQVLSAASHKSRPAAGVDSRDRNEFADAEFPSDVLAEEFLDEDAFKQEGSLAEFVAYPEEPDEAELALAADPASASFVRRAEQQAKWSSPRMRFWLSSAAALLSLSLGVQAAHHFRDGLNARLPSSRPWLASWCETVGCKLGLPKRIEDVVIDSSTLTKAPNAAEAFQFSVSLRNQGRHAIAVPAIDLRLTDVAGQLIARRVLLSADFGSTASELAVDAPLPLQVVLSAGGQRISGYTAEPFYP